MTTINIPHEEGLSYRLDLQEGSVSLSPAVNQAARRLPLCLTGYGHFIAGAGHFTFRDQSRQAGQVFITHRGSGRFWAKGQEFVAGPGTVAVLDFNHPHRYETKGEVWDYEFVNFYGPASLTYCGLINDGIPGAVSLGTDQEIVNLVNGIHAHARDRDMAGLVHMSTRIILLLDAVYGLTVRQQREDLASVEHNIIRSRDYIHAHFAEHLPLDRLAQAAFLSKYHYTRAFKRYMGMTPCEYLSSVRVSEARRLLIHTSLSVEEIGFQTGFGGAKNLIRHFKDATGVTPGWYRQNAGGL